MFDSQCPDLKKVSPAVSALLDQLQFVDDVRLAARGVRLMASACFVEASADFELSLAALIRQVASLEAFADARKMDIETSVIASSVNQPGPQGEVDEGFGRAA